MDNLKLFRRITVLFFILFVVVFTANAQTRVHEVKSGETLSSIAQAYQMTAGELRALNKLTSERIEVGTKLKVRDVEPILPGVQVAASGLGNIPVRMDDAGRTDTTSRTTASTQQTRTTQTPPPPAPQEPTVQIVESTHMVRPGETLFSIARQYEITVADLKKLNNLVGNDISAGQRLKVFTTVIAGSAVTQTETPPAETRRTAADDLAERIAAREAAQTANTTEQRPPVETVAETGTQTAQTARETVSTSLPDSLGWYTVRPGDSLPSIARDFRMSVADLRELNGLTENRVYPGDKMRVRAVPGLTEIEDRGQPQPPPPVMVEEPPVVPPVQETRREEPPVATAPPVQEVPPPAVEEVVDERPVLAEPDFSVLNEMTHPGRFIGHTVKRNERLSAILEAYKMEEAEFFALNPSLDGRAPRAGIEVLVYEPPANLKPNPYVSAETAASASTEPVSIYTDEDRGKLTTSGELYNPLNLTAAHSTFPLGAVLYVVNPQNGRGTYVRVNDRTERTGILLSENAAQILGLDPVRPANVYVTKE